MESGKISLVIMRMLGHVYYISEICDTTPGVNYPSFPCNGEIVGVLERRFISSGTRNF